MSQFSGHRVAIDWILACARMTFSVMVGCALLHPPYWIPASAGMDLPVPRLRLYLNLIPPAPPDDGDASAWAW